MTAPLAIIEPNEPDHARAHPAKFTGTVVTAIQDALAPLAAERNRRIRVLDPFAGTGRIHYLPPWCETVGVEIEHEWASTHPRTIVGNAQRLPFPDASFDAVATSVCYGNRMADLYDGRDGSRRHTYRIALGRDLSFDSAAGLQWGALYRSFHERFIIEALRVVAKGGLVVINISNHVRDGEVQQVVEWWLTTLLNMGLGLVAATPVTTPRMRHGKNHEARVETEHLLVMRVVTDPPTNPPLF